MSNPNDAKLLAETKRTHDLLERLLVGLTEMNDRLEPAVHMVEKVTSTRAGKPSAAQH